MVSTFAASAHFFTCPVMSSGLGSHQTPVAILDLVMDLKSGPALIGPILVEILEFWYALEGRVVNRSLV